MKTDELLSATASTLLPVPPAVQPEPEVLSSLPLAAAYEATVEWEQYVAGRRQKSQLKRQMRMAVGSSETGRLVSIQLLDPVLSQPEALQPLEQLGLRLATLFEQLRLAVGPEGQIQQVLNYVHLTQVWAQLRARLLGSAPPDDQLTATLVQLLDKQMMREENIRHSLLHDYLYHTITDALRDGALAGPTTREFPHFFPNLSLYFTEVRPTAPGGEGPPGILVRGTVDGSRTELAAIGQLMRAALEAAGGPPPDPSLQPHFGYEAQYEPRPEHGYFFPLTLTVYVRLGSVYNKQYTLTLTPAL